jgi:hypothetical protein
MSNLFEVSKKQSGYTYRELSIELGVSFAYINQVIRDPSICTNLTFLERLGFFIGMRPGLVRVEWARLRQIRLSDEIQKKVNL